jgi:hypothetical protein
MGANIAGAMARAPGHAPPTRLLDPGGPTCTCPAFTWPRLCAIEGCRRDQEGLLYLCAGMGRWDAPGECTKVVFSCETNVACVHYSR